MKFDLSQSNSYLIYARRSTDDLVNQKNSIDYQIDQCRRYAKASALPIASISAGGFCENGVIQERHTAFKTAALKIDSDGTVRYRIERPKFQQLVSVLVTQQCRGIICLCWDRLSRNPHDDAVIKDLLARHIDIRFVQATYDRSSAGALHMDIDGMFAAHYSRVSSEKIRGANAKLRAEGKCTNRAPIGYLDQGPGCKPLDPERAPIIKRMFRFYATGDWSMSALARWARDQGLTTKPQRGNRTPEEIAAGLDNPRRPVSHPVTEKTVEKILHNPFYCGRLRYGDEELEGSHSPLISSQVFDQVQRALGMRTTTVHYIDKEFFTYRGLVRCTCQRSYSPYRRKGHVYYYVPCRPGCNNGQASLRDKNLDAIVEGLLGRIHLSDEERAELEARAPTYLRDTVEQQTQAEEVRKLRRSRLEQDLAYLNDNRITLLREGAYTIADYQCEVRRIKDELAADETSPRQLADQTDPVAKVQTITNFSELVKLAKESYKYASDAKKRSLFLAAFSELSVYEGNVANVRAKDGFQKLLERPVPSSCGPKFVFSELNSIYQAILISVSILRQT